LAILPLILTLVGIVLAYGQFLYNRSIWLDEAFIALNLMDRSIPELMTPLDNNQVAPLLFLVVEKLFSEMMPGTEFGLRILPLLCYVIAALVFLRIVRKLFTDLGTQVFAVSLFVFNGNLIYYASELKQYMSDVTVAVVLVWLVLRYTRDNRGLNALGAFAVVAIWSSSTTPMVAVPAFAYVIHHRSRQKASERSSLPVLLFWAALWCGVFLSYYVLVVRDHPAKTFMRQFWINANGLLPNDPFSAAFYHGLYDRAYMVFTLVLPYGIKNIYLLPTLFIIGCIGWSSSQHRGLMILFALPILLHVLLAILHIYPFETRLILYLIPFFILISAEGLRLVLRLFLHARSPLMRWSTALSIPVVLALIFVRIGYPKDKQEIKPCLAFIVANAAVGDALYVDAGAIPAFTYYDKVGKYVLELPVHLSIQEDDPEGYMRNAMDLHGPTWFLFTHQRKNTTNKITAQLDSLGYTRMLEHHARNAHVYRYDMP